MTKTFAKIAKTFARLSTTIIATKRRPVLILHLEAKFAKIDCKNEIYAKNWVRSTWTTKVNYGKKSTVKVNSKSKSTLVNDDVSKRNLAHDSAWMRVGAREGSWQCVEVRGARELLRRIFWRRVRAGGSSDDCQVSTRR